MCLRRPKKKRRASAFGSILSEPMQEFLGQESMPRTEVWGCWGTALPGPESVPCMCYLGGHPLIRLRIAEATCLA